MAQSLAPLRQILDEIPALEGHIEQTAKQAREWIGVLGAEVQARRLMARAGSLADPRRRDPQLSWIDPAKGEAK